MQELKINKEFQNLLWPLSSEEYASLEKSIKEDGCRDSIIIWDNTIVDGHNRWDICQKHNISFTTINRNFHNDEEAKDWIDENQLLNRRNLTDDQRRIVRGRLYNRIKKAVGKPIDGNGVNTADRLAKEFGVSPATIKRDSRFVVEVEKDEEYQRAIKDKLPINKIKKQKKIEKRKELIEQIKQKISDENIQITDKFDVVCIDPPWPYTREYDPEASRGATPYPTMSLEDIGNIELPVKDDAVVFLWTTHQFLKDAFVLLDKWNLTYKATFVWDKELMGIGSTIRLQCEFCLLATKGSPIIQGTDTRDIIREPRREHSRKPDSFYEMVDKITIGNKIDYFSREQREGWVSFGIEADKFV